MLNKVLKKIWTEIPVEIIKEIDYSKHKPKKILFYHLPKCGGSSMILYLRKNYPRRKIYSIKPKNGNDYNYPIELYKSFSTEKRHNYDLIYGHGAKELLEYVSPDCLTLTVFREPIDRIISHYYYAKKTPTHYLNNLIHEKNLSIEEYINLDATGELRNYYTTRFSGLSLEEAEKYPEKSITKALETIKKYDFVGTLDNLDSLMKKLQQVANLKYSYDNSERINIGVKAKSESLLSITESVAQINFLDVILYEKIQEIHC